MPTMLVKYSPWSNWKFALDERPLSVRNQFVGLILKPKLVWRAFPNQRRPAFMFEGEYVSLKESNLISLNTALHAADGHHAPIDVLGIRFDTSIYPPVQHGWNFNAPITFDTFGPATRQVGRASITEFQAVIVSFYNVYYRYLKGAR